MHPPNGTRYSIVDTVPHQISGRIHSLCIGVLFLLHRRVRYNPVSFRDCPALALTNRSCVWERFYEYRRMLVI